MTKKRDGLFGSLLLITGAIIGVATTLLIKEERPMKAGLVLNKIKKQFARQGSITGTWIDYDPIEYDVFEAKPLVYIGGISIESQEGKIHYQFASDIYTGELLDSYVINPENIK